MCTAGEVREILEDWHVDGSEANGSVCFDVLEHCLLVFVENAETPDVVVIEASLSQNIDHSNEKVLIFEHPKYRI